ncbi:MAG TPA: hypothetical protein VHE61_24390 [Opitutaceae bacterium]|nr:hypothetical protein [Opitutaceae bacterium]
MNSPTPLVRSLVTGSLALRRLPSASRLPAGVSSRTGLPVVSNRAFVAAWTARRDLLVATARRARQN